MAKPKSAKAVKPRADFPLFPHQAGYWCKKVRGKLHYFGKVANDPKGQAALSKWLEQRDDLLAGRVPRVKVEGLTVRDLCNRFLSAKRDLLDADEINPRTFADLHATCKRVGKAFGWDRPVSDLVADDFDRLRRASASLWGPHRLSKEIQGVRSLFNFGFEAGLMQQPVRYGPTFKKPSKKVLRLQRAKKGPRMFESHELRQVIDAAPIPLKAMILLGVNAGMGNTDVASLPRRAVDLKRGWIDFPRPKTGIARRCPLWPETATAIGEALASRPTPRAGKYSGLVFLTTRGNPWRICERADRENGDFGLRLNDFIGRKFGCLLKDLKVHRLGVGFYTLRHVFETIAGDSRDQVAVDAIMGHARDDMASVYRERIDDARLVAVVNHVHKWLFGETENK
jgi:integrase